MTPRIVLVNKLSSSWYVVMMMNSSVGRGGGVMVDLTEGEIVRARREGSAYRTAIVHRSFALSSVAELGGAG